MSPPPPPPAIPDPDELASAVVDGLLAPADAEAALRDPAVAQAVEQLEQLRSAVRATPPAPVHLADRMIANAIAATQAERAPEVVAFRPPPPAPARRTRLAPWLAAAAAILVVGLVAIGLLAQGGDDSEDQATDAALDKSDRPSDDKAEAGAGGEGTTTRPDAEAESPSAAPEDEQDSAAVLSDLGSFSSADELAADVKSRVARGEGKFDANATEDPPESERESCSGLTQAGDPDRGSAVFAGAATYKDNPVVVHVYEANGQQRLVATDRSCSDVVDRPFTGG